MKKIAGVIAPSRHDVSRYVFVALAVLGQGLGQGIAGCGVGAAEDDGRAQVVKGLERALPDDKLGPTAAVAADPLPPDPLQRNPVRAARAAGARDLAYSSKTIWTLALDDGRSVRIDEVVDIQLDAAGQYEGTRRRNITSPDGGRVSHVSHARYVGGGFYVSTEAGEYWRIPPMRDPHIRWLDGASDTFSVIAEALGPAMRRTSTADRLSLSLESSRLAERPWGPSLRDDLKTWGEWWRGAHSIEELSGEASVHQAWNAPERVHMTLAARVIREAAAGRMRVVHESTLQPLDTPPRLVAPDDSREPRRRRVARLVDEVVGRESAEMLRDP